MPRRKPSRPIREIEEERARTVYLRFPHIIRDAKEVEKLCVGDFQVKLRRQASRDCRVIFSSVEEKVKNEQTLQDEDKTGMRIVVDPPQISVFEKKTKKLRKKKIVIPDVKTGEKMTQTLHVSNIKVGTKAVEIKQALQGCISVTLLKANQSNRRTAIVKMEDPYIAQEYLKKEREWPKIQGNTIKIRPDTRQKHKKKKKSSKSILKIYNGDTTTDECKQADSEELNEEDVQESDEEMD